MAKARKTPHLFGLFPDATFSFLVRSEWNSQKANREGITISLSQSQRISSNFFRINKLDADNLRVFMGRGAQWTKKGG